MKTQHPILRIFSITGVLGPHNKGLIVIDHPIDDCSHLQVQFRVLIHIIDPTNILSDVHLLQLRLPHPPLIFTLLHLILFHEVDKRSGHELVLSICESNFFRFFGGLVVLLVG